MQQAVYSSVLPTTNDAQLTMGNGQWFHHAPTTAPSSARPAVPLGYSVQVGPMTTYSPSTHDSQNTRPNSFAEQQQQFIPDSSSANAPMMVREPRSAVGVYDPAVVGPSGLETGRSSRAGSNAGEMKDPAKRESSDGEKDNEADSKATYDNPNANQRTLRPRPSTTGPATHPVNDAEDTSDASRPRKRSKRTDPPPPTTTTDSTDDLIAVKANGKGNQFILTLYAYVPFPSLAPPSPFLPAGARTDPRGV